MLSTTVLSPGLLLTPPAAALSPASCSALSSASRSKPILAADKEPSWWDKLLYGRQGTPPAPPTPPPPTPKISSKLFAQWDRDQNGELEPVELKRALLAVGLESEELDEVLAALGADDGSSITYEALEERLPPGARATIEARLNEDGVMESLYVPPEKWEDTKSAEELRKDQWIEFEARRSGNALRQNEILGKELGKG